MMRLGVTLGLCWLVMSSVYATEHFITLNNSSSATFLLSNINTAVHVDHLIQIDGLTTNQDSFDLVGKQVRPYYYQSQQGHGTLQIAIDYCDALFCFPSSWQRACYVTLTEQGANVPPMIVIEQLPQQGPYACVQAGDGQISFVNRH